MDSRDTRTAWFAAVNAGDAEAVQALLARGCHLEHDGVEVRCDRGATAMHHAVVAADLQVARLLLRAGLNSNARCTVAGGALRALRASACAICRQPQRSVRNFEARCALVIACLLLRCRHTLDVGMQPGQARGREHAARSGRGSWAAIVACAASSMAHTGAIYLVLVCRSLGFL